MEMLKMSSKRTQKNRKKNDIAINKKEREIKKDKVS